MRNDIIGLMIASFLDADTEMLWNTGKSRRIPASIRRTVFKKLANPECRN